MPRNFTNLTIVAVIVFFVFGCFQRSEREVQSGAAPPPPAPNSLTAEPASHPNANQKDAPSASWSAGSAKNDAGDFLVQQSEAQNPRYARLEKQLSEEKVLENAAAQLNQSLGLPFDITLRTKTCGEVNAFYDPNDHSITVCYELPEYYFKLFKSAGHSDEAAAGNMKNAVYFAFLHEVGHALIDAYRLPITGSEEDAADRCSAYLSLEEIPDGVKYVMAAADAFSIESKLLGASKRRAADEHLLGEQRFYNSLCMIYGSNPDKYANFLTNQYLPESRAVRCQSEYERTIYSWRELLRPWRKE